MKILLDSANLEEIKAWTRSSAIAGVTTNPSLVAKEPRSDYFDLVQKTIDAFKEGAEGAHHLSVEVTTLDPHEMINQAIRINNLNTGDRLLLYVKIPVAVETMRVISKLASMDIMVNATACMTALQAKMASDAGASVVSFFYNRMIDHNIAAGLEKNQARLDARYEIRKYDRHKRNGAADCICGSIRLASDIEECFDDGADYVTTNSNVLSGIIRHPKTVESIENFQKDFEAWRA